MAKIIPVPWCKGLVLLPLVAAHALAAGNLAALVSACRQSPSPAKKAAIQSYAAAHPKEAGAARLALGVIAFEQQDYPGAVAALKRVSIPQIADYTAFYLASARVEAKDTAGVSQDLAPVRSTEVRSPLAGRSWLVEGRALGPAAIPLLREHYAELPQPDGDLALADAYQAASDLPHAAEFYQRVFYQYVTGDAADRASAALDSLKSSMGASYPAPLPQQKLQRASRLLDARKYPEARSEYEALINELVGPDRDLARVRIGAADISAGRPGPAAPYLRALDLSESEADAERLYWLAEAYGRMNNETNRIAIVAQLAHRYSRSPWRLRATVSAANRYLVLNKPDEYLPLYRAAYVDFPADPQAGLYHWKLTFNAYLRDRAEADDLLREQIRNYPLHPTAAAALYFLGRHYEKRGDLASAHAMYDRIVRAYPNQFYAIQARDRLRVPEIAAAPASPDADRFLAETKTPDQKPLPSEPTRPTAIRIERSRLLRAAGLTDFADNELRYGARNDGQPQLLAMEIASSADSAYVALRAMKAYGGDYLTLPLELAPRRYWEMLFPMPYKTELQANARLRGLDPFLVAGLIRQESEFNPVATSGKANGLMQVRPSTGREVARKAGIPRFTSRLLNQPSSNLRIGTYILRSMLDAHDGRIEETLAAYNAGPARAAEWRTWAAFREPAEFVETIPFTETRDYVQAVLRNAEMYRRLYK